MNIKISKEMAEALAIFMLMNGYPKTKDALKEASKAFLKTDKGKRLAAEEGERTAKQIIDYL